MTDVRRFALMLALAAVAGCSGTMRVDSERNPTVSFARYRTYDWVSSSPDRPRIDPRISPRMTASGGRDLLDWRIRTDVETQLAVKGYVRAPDAPDFLVDYHITRSEKFTDSIGDFIKYRESGGQEGPQDAYVFGYDEATLVLEVFDASTQQRVWRATATTANVNPDDQKQLVTEAVGRMLEQFPRQ